MKKRLAALTALAILLICLSACRATEQEGFEPEEEKHSSNSSAYIVEPKGEDETVVSQTDTSKTSGVFDFALPRQLQDTDGLLSIEPRLTTGVNTDMDVFPMRYHSIGNWHLALYNFLQRVF